MKNIIRSIQLASDIPQESQQEWKDLSEELIATGDIERLSEKGLIQAVDLLGWHFATDTVLFMAHHFSDEEWEYVIDVKSEQMDEIMDTMASGSGIHPAIIAEMVRYRANEYEAMYLTQEFCHV